MIIKTKFDMYQIVYLSHDIHKIPRTITRIETGGYNDIGYRLHVGESSSRHNQKEIESKVIIKKVGYK